MTPIENIHRVLLELLLTPDFVLGKAYAADPWIVERTEAIQASKAASFDTLRSAIQLEERIARIERALAVKLEELPCIADPS